MYFIAVVALFVIVGAAGALYVHLQARHDARAMARADTSFAAKTAGAQLALAASTVRGTVAAVAANPQIGQLIAHPAACTLSFSLGGGASDRSQLSLLRPDGTVVCSSRVPGGKPQPGYRGASWLAQARAGAIFMAPVHDAATGAEVALSAVPVPGHGIVVCTIDLEAVGPRLASLYGGGRPLLFLVTNSTGTVVTASAQPKRWIGTSIEGTAFARAAGKLERPGLDGRTGLYSETAVSGVGWRFFVGEDTSAVFGSLSTLEKRELAIILAGLLVMLIGTWFAYRRVAHPLGELGEAVRGNRARTPLEPVGVHGPAEIAALAADVNGLIASVNDELAAREQAEADQRRLEEQLRQAQKMEAIGKLASGIAHDFNNILMIIRTCAALQLAHADDNDVRGNALEIDSAAERAGELTHQLLAFSRQQVLEPEELDLNAVVESLFDLLKRLLGEGIELVQEREDGLESIVADRSQVNQVILNLAVNARDAMPDGGVLILRTSTVFLDEQYASEHLDVTPGSYSVLQITDTGAGMDEATRARAFEPFFTTKELGTGFGLATVHGIVTQSGGHIWLYSEPGLGTTFKIYFPVAAQPARLPHRSHEVRSLTGRETILYVEDEAHVRPLIARALRGFGYTVLEAADASEAIALAEANDGIDMLVTDVVMPGMNGRELADTLSARRPELKVLFTSGYPADAILRNGIADVRRAYLEKPYLPDKLAHALRAVLEVAAD